MNKRRLLLMLLLLLSLPLTAVGQDMVSAPGEFPIVEEPITLNILMLGSRHCRGFPDEYLHELVQRTHRHQSQFRYRAAE